MACFYRRNFFFLVLIYFLAIVVAGCSWFEEKKPAPLLVGVSIAHCDQEIVDIMRKEFIKRQEKDHIRIIWRESDEETQKQDIEKLVKRGIKALIVRLADPELGPEIAHLVAENDLKLVAMDIPSQGIQLDGFIAANAFRVGKMQGQFLLENLTKRQGKTVIFLRGTSENYVADRIVEGLRDILRKHPEITFVEKRASCEDQKEINSVLNRILSNFGDSLGALVIPNEHFVYNAINVFKAKEFLDKVVLVGVGGSKKLAQSLAQGDMNALVDVNPMMTAQRAYDAAIDLIKKGDWEYTEHFSGGDIPAKTIPIKLVTKDNIGLMEQRWGKLPKEKEVSGDEQGKNTQERKIIIITDEGKTTEVKIKGEIKNIKIQ